MENNLSEFLICILYTMLYICVLIVFIHAFSLFKVIMNFLETTRSSVFRIVSFSITYLIFVCGNPLCSKIISVFCKNLSNFYFCVWTMCDAVNTDEVKLIDRVYCISQFLNKKEPCSKSGYKCSIVIDWYSTLICLCSLNFCRLLYAS